MKPDAKDCAHGRILEGFVEVGTGGGQVGADRETDLAIGGGESQTKRGGLRGDDGGVSSRVRWMWRGDRLLITAAREARVLPSLSKAATEEESPKTFCVSTKSMPSQEKAWRRRSARDAGLFL